MTVMELFNAAFGGRGGIPGLLTHVMRRAAQDHGRRDMLTIAQDAIGDLRGSGWSRGSAAACYLQDRKDRDAFAWPYCRGGWPMVRVNEITFFDTPREGISEGAIGTVDVTYDHDGGRAGALYGFYSNGDVVLWAN
jgi:hypothetical protein